MAKESKSRKARPKQKQEKQPGVEGQMVPEPVFQDSRYIGSNKLIGKIALISGGDSGIGKATAIAFAKEGADVAIIYLNEHADAIDTKKQIEQYNRKCLLIDGDISLESFCQKAVKKTIDNFGKLDVLVNNAAVQFPQESLLDIDEKQLDLTFRTNIYSYFFLTKACLIHLKRGASIINSTSVTAYRGSHHLIDYASTKGAIVSFTRSLSKNLAEKGIRVNGVAPGPVWTPLIPASFDAGQVADFGSDVPLKRAAQPFEIAPAYVFLASSDSVYFTGQVLHPNGGEIIGG
jgi:NAD(P)-dependent dehydrogenase (short-subunit alcohol dehydrogenase family)